MDFVYPQDFAGAKSGKFSFIPLGGTIQLRRNFSRINADAFRKSQATITEVEDYAVRIEQTCEENQKYVVQCAQCIADRTGMTDDEIELLNSPWDSDFWAIQPIEEVEAVIKIFRGRNNL